MWVACLASLETAGATSDLDLNPLQGLGSVPGHDTRGFAAYLVFLLYGKKLVGLCPLEHSSTHRAVEEPWGKKQSPHSFLIPTSALL